MKVGEFIGGSWLKAEDLHNRQVKVRIERYEPEQVGDKTKPVLYFYGKEKGLAMNTTNLLALREAWGDEMDDWLDQWIVLRTERVNFGGKMVPAIRVSPAGVQQQAPAQQQRRTAPAPEPEPEPGFSEEPDDSEIPF